VVSLSSHSYGSLGYELERYLLDSNNINHPEKAAALDTSKWTRAGEEYATVVEDNLSLIRSDSDLTTLARKQIADFRSDGQELH